MNKQRTIDLIRHRFSTLSEVGPELIRAEERYGEAALGVFYYDLSQAPGRSDFLLPEYLQKHIANDFYQHEGSLQWNYYLYFVMDKSQCERLQQEGKTASIEADRTFARKFIVDEKTLQETLTKTLSSKIYTANRPKDMAASWTETLSNAGLGKICDPNAPYTDIVEEFLERESSNNVGRTAIPTARAVPPGKLIERLEIQRFREFPLQKTFDFGTVNLIRGANGSGKTSLLEAIELSICGGIRRQGNTRPSDGSSILIKYQGESEPRKTPTNDVAAYREIDAAWYGAYYRSLNKLCENFGRFNFFDSDAGFRLAEGKSAEKIRKAIESLFLGDYASTLEQMMVRCKDKFETKEHEFAKEVSTQKDEISKLEENLETVRRIRNTRETLFKELKAKGANSGWKRIPGRFKVQDLVALSEAVEGFSSQLADYLRQLRWLPNVSLRSLRQVLTQLDTALQEIQKKQSAKEKANESLEKSKDALKSVEAKLRLLVRLLNYHAETEAFSLKGATSALQTHKTRLDQMKAAAALVKGIDLTPFENSSATLDYFSDEHAKEIAAQKRLISQKRKRIASLQKQFGELKALVEQIKGLGRHLCELKPDTKDCPLCGAQYENGLLDSISAHEAEEAIDSSLRELTADASLADMKLKSLEQTNDAFGKLREAASFVQSQNQLRSQSLKSIVEAMVALTEQITAVRMSVEQLTLKINRLQLLGYSEAELEQLFSDATEIYELSLTKLTNAEVMRTIVRTQSQRAETLRKDLRKIEKEIKDADTELVALVKGALAGTVSENPIVALQRRKSSIEQALVVVRDGEELMSIPDAEEFSSIRSRLKSFSEAIARIQEALKQVEEKDELEKKWDSELKAVKRKTLQSRTKRDRAREALKVLNGLLKGKNKNEFLEGIVNQQHEKLVAIFRNIHAPHEFDGVRLKDDVYLSRRNGKEATLTEISTGQRCALALAIFLSMNSSIGNRAPWLLFDDPIAHVDDLNTLSFLDSLRELVLSGKRQMFFATANTRVANLFARKFDFLGDSFKNIPLDRAD